MASRLTRFGNDLYTGKRSFPFVGRRRLWYLIALVLLVLSVLAPILRGGFNLGIEFRGGSQFQVAGVEIADDQTTADVQNIAEEAVAEAVPGTVSRVSVVGDSGVRVQTDQLSDSETREVTAALAAAYDVPEADVAYSFIGPSWGQDVTRQAIIGLIVFIVLAAVGMALYFRTWKLSAAAISSLIAELVITAGVYAASGFEVTPAAMIGFLTILAYSLYDKVVVFDKIRENTRDLTPDSTQTFAEAVNLAVNQTLVRSINTSVVAALPVAAILFIGAFALGADTLRDISLALLIGILVGTWSTVFLAAPFYSQIREGEPKIKAQDAKILERRARAREGASLEGSSA